jgi:hypothetical protein
LRGGAADSSVKDFSVTIGGQVYNWAFRLRCSFCMRGPPFADYHGVDQCPLISTMNKFREQEGYQLITTSNGLVTMPTERRSVDVDKRFKGLEKKMADLEKRIVALEPKSKGSKRKASDADPGPSKKSKLSPSKTDKKKKDKGKAKAKS